jgi:hypothetical protein
MRSLRKRVSSRRQTIFIARSSLRQLRGGTRTRMTSAPGHHLHHHPIGVLVAGLLGVADRRAGVRHEDVVERRARDADRPDRDAQLGEEPRDELLAGGHEEGHGALGDRRLEVEALGQRRDGRVVVLGLDPHPVGADLRLERLGRVESDDLALVHDRDPVAELGLVHVVRGHEDRDLLALLQLGDVAPDRAARLRVQADGGLVEEEHARRVQEAARDLQASAHAAREGHHRRAAALPQPDHLEHLAHPAGDERGVDAVELGVQAQVLLGGEVAVERRVLEDEADVAPDVVALAHDVVAGDARAARRRLGQRAQHVDGGRLPGAVGPEEAEDLPGRHLEADTAHGLDLAKGLAQVVDLDRQGRFSHRKLIANVR